MSNPREGAAPPTWKLMLVKWLGLFPALVAINYAIGFLPLDPPVPLKILMQTVVAVPLLHYVITPLMDDWFGDWLYAGIDEAGRESIDVGC